MYINIAFSNKEIGVYTLYIKYKRNINNPFLYILYK